MDLRQQYPSDKGCFCETRKILEGGTGLRWVYVLKFWSIWCPSREGLRRSHKNKNEILGPSALLTGINNYISAELSQ